MTKGTHQIHKSAHSKPGKKHDKKHDDEENVEDEGEWVDAEEGAEGEAGTIGLDLRELKAQLDRLYGAAPVSAAVGLEGQEKIALVENIRSGIIVINQYRPVAIGEEERLSTTATGFIVDRKRGIILTNRHVRHIGPCRSEAVLYDKSIVELEPIYVDPIHDFGFFQLKEHREDLVEIELAPQDAIPGTEIFVVGNNSAESLMILPSVLARVDRECPQYDMNTFYCTGANNTSGGSSGSPVLTKAGKAVALNSGGKVDTAVSYFLPLEGIVFALERIQKGERVPRGDLYTVWKQYSYAESKRLGLPDKLLHEVKAQKNVHQGMLIAEAVLKDCKDMFKSKKKRILVGDILLKVSNKAVTDHWTLERLLGEHVGKEVTLEVFRDNSVHTITVQVQDLDYANPTKILVFNASSFHEVTYNTAMNQNIERKKRVYLAEAGSMFAFSSMASGMIIESVNHEEVRDLDHFMTMLQTLCNSTDKRAKLCNLGPQDFENKFYDIVFWDMKFYGPPVLWTRDLQTCDWTYSHCEAFTSCKQIAPAVSTKRSEPRSPINVTLAPTSVSSMISNSLQSMFQDVSVKEFTCVVQYSQPVWMRANPSKAVEMVLGEQKPTYLSGIGLVLDCKLGLVLASRSIVPDSFGEVRMKFTSCEDVFGKVVFVHPVYNWAVVQYDPTDPKLSPQPVASAAVSAAVSPAGSPSASNDTKKKTAAGGVKIRNAVFNKDTLHTKIHVGKEGVLYSLSEESNSIALPANGAVVTNTCVSKAEEQEGQYFPSKGSDCFILSGTERTSALYLDNNSSVLGLFDAFTSACEFVDPVLDIITKNGELVRTVQVFPAKIYYKSVDEMRTFGVPSVYVDRVEAYFAQRNQRNDAAVCISVMKVSHSQCYHDVVDEDLEESEKDGAKDKAAPSDEMKLSELESQDLILEVDDQPVYRLNDIHAAAAKSSLLKLKIFRMSNGQVVDILVETRSVATMNFDQIVTWCGVHMRNVDDYDVDLFTTLHDADDDEDVAEVQEALSASKKAVVKGVMINGVEEGTPGEIFGIFPYGLLLKINSTRITSVKQCLEVITSIKHNESVTLKIIDPSGQSMIQFLVTDYKNTTTLQRALDWKTFDWKTSVVSHDL